MFVPLIRDITHDLFFGVKISANENVSDVCYFTLLFFVKKNLPTYDIRHDCVIPTRGMTTKSKTGLPSTEDIVKEAYENVEKNSPEKLKPDYIKKNFSEMNELLFYGTYEVYKIHEKKAFDNMTQKILDGYDQKSFSKNDVKKILSVGVQKSSEFEKSLKQSRASRAGKAYEFIVMDLLDRMGIKNEHITKEDKKSGLRPIDIVIPDRDTAINNPDQAQFLSLKTSLKDRWKLVVEDQKQGQRTHLLTLLQNEKMSTAVAEKISENGIFTYVPDKIKDEQFKSLNRIRKLSDLPSKLLK